MPGRHPASHDARRAWTDARFDEVPTDADPLPIRALSRVEVRLFDADGEDRPVEPTEDVVRSLGPKRLLWVDLEDRDDEGTMSEVVRVLGLKDVDLDRLRTGEGRAHLTRTADRLHVTLEAMETKERDDADPMPDDADLERIERRELHIIAAPNIVLTVHDGHVAALQRFRDGLDGETRLGQLTSAELMSSLVDEVIVGYFLLAELVEREIDQLDQRALEARPGDDVLGAIVALRHQIGLIRRTLAPHRDALSTLGMPEMDVHETIGRPWPGLVDRLEAAVASVESLRDGLLGTFDIHMGRVSQRANDVMRTLTLLSAVLLPAVVLAGIMGMNFQVGFFDDPTYFWWVLVGMAVMAVAIVFVARLRHWL